MKFVLLAAMMVLAIASPFGAFAQSSGADTSDTETPDAVDQGDAIPVMQDAPAPIATLVPTVAPTAVPVIPVQATILKTTAPVCALGAKKGTARCTTELLPNPDNPAPRLSQYDWSPGPISQIPSPVGAPIFSDYRRPISGVDYMEYRLAAAPLATYVFNCGSGQCSGSAEDVWRTMPTAQREQFLVDIIHAEQANQSWNPAQFMAAVIALGGPPQEPTGRGCAVMRASDSIVRFGTSCNAPLGDHLN